MRRERSPSVAERNRLEYEKRVNRVIDHIYDHLGEELSLATLAHVAAFSPFHFDRVFAATTGETLFGFLQRLRIERAAMALRDHADQSVLAIALDHGFGSAATFARAFKARFGMSATEWRAGGAERWRTRRARQSHPGKQFRNAGKASRRRSLDTPRKRREEGAMKVQVRELPTYRVAYMRYVGPYGAHGIPELWAKFNKWMDARGPLSGTRITLGIAHDDPAVTSPEKCRYDACVVIPADFQADRWVNVTDIPNGKYAITQFVGTAHEIAGAWSGMYTSWLPESGYQPDDRPCLEVYRGNPTVDAKSHTFRCELCVPVRPL